MFRAGARLVIPALAACWLALAAGCAQELPKPVMIDDAFSAEEEALIVEMIGEWNRVGREYLGLDEIISYRGRLADADGFDVDDLEDEYSVIYRGVDDERYRYLEDVDNDGLTLLGYGTTADVLLYAFNFADDREFRHVVLHELGHFLSLLHVPDDTAAVMYYLTGPDPPVRLNRTDIRAFCLVYDCIRRP